MMRLSIGYPSHDAELTMLKSNHNHLTLDQLPQCLTPMALMQLQEQCDKVSASDALLNYILALVSFSRSQSDSVGLSPRATKALLQAAKAWAFLEGRHYLVPEDVQAVFCCVAEHRLRTSSQLQGEALSERILASVNPIM
ncbi:hypothetical protein LFREDSHE_22020 [Shewanella baltica]